MDLFVSELVNGVVLAAFFGLVAAGLALIFGVVGVVNFAHGDFVMLGGYIFLEFYTVMHWPYLVAILVTTVTVAAIGAVAYVIALRHLISRAWHTQLLATLAISILLENVVQAIWSPSARSVATPYTLTRIHLGNSVTLTLQDIFVWIGTALCLGLLWWIIARTKWGKAMRALSQNREACAVTGINASAVALLAFTIAVALCGVAATLVLPLQNIYPTVGLSITTQAFVVVILGGMGSVQGAVAAAFIVGWIDAFGAGYLSTGYTDAFGYAVMILILLVRPTGLFGIRQAQESTGL